MSSRANPIFLTHPLSDGRYLLACWNWNRRYLADELPDRWEVITREQLAVKREAFQQAGFRPIHPLETRREQIWKQIQAAQKPPQMTPKQRAKYEARQARKREQEELESEYQRKLSGQSDQFRQAFVGLNQDGIRRQYRTLARIYHPDAGGSADSFRLLEAAYRAALRGY